MKWNAQPTQDVKPVAPKSSDRVTIWRTLGALTLGALLYGVGILCSRWVNDSPLLSTALQSAFSGAVLAALAPVRSQDLILGMQSLQTHSVPEDGSAQEAQNPYGQRRQAQLGLVAL